MIACSVRDLLGGGQHDASRQDEMLALFERYFDHLLVHGDPTLVPFDRTFRHAPRLGARLHYTGYIVDRGPGEASEAGKEEVIVSAGGGAVGERLLDLAGYHRPLANVRDGALVMFDATNPNVTTAPNFVNLVSRVTFQGEAGLLGLAFHPDFPADPRAFVNYIRNSGGQLQSITSEFRSIDGGLTLDATSERILLVVNKMPNADNHNGGNLAFGPDGFLYIGLGDGGGAGDSLNNAQNRMRLLGKMLRIDIDSIPAGQPYGIPPDNPHVGNARCNANGTGAQECPEIYAVGLRNPWRWSFDRQSGQLWLADVGQNAWEEIDIITRNGNYGWRIREGAHCFNPSSGCQTAGLIDPVAEYSHSVGQSITGGYVYRGAQTTELFGRYMFADFVSGLVGSLAPAPGGGFTITQHGSERSSASASAASASRMLL